MRAAFWPREAQMSPAGTTPGTIAIPMACYRSSWDSREWVRIGEGQVRCQAIVWKVLFGCRAPMTVASSVISLAASPG